MLPSIRLLLRGGRPNNLRRVHSWIEPLLLGATRLLVTLRLAKLRSQHHSYTDLRRRGSKIRHTDQAIRAGARVSPGEAARTGAAIDLQAAQQP